jgi:hypothetical protein
MVEIQAVVWSIGSSSERDRHLDDPNSHSTDRDDPSLLISPADQAPRRSPRPSTLPGHRPEARAGWRNSILSDDRGVWPASVGLPRGGLRAIRSQAIPPMEDTVLEGFDGRQRVESAYKRAM